jgi:hypothetical protein
MAKTAMITGTTLYSSLKKPKKKYESERLEFSIEIAVSKAEARTWDKTFKKQPAKVMDNQDFVKIFGMDLPFPDQEDQYIIKLKRPADYEEKNKETNEKTGRVLPIPEKYRPRLLLLTDPVTRKCKDITYENYGLGRGSIVTAQYEERDSGKFGTTSRLMNVRVDNLIKYEFGNSFDELGSVDELAENPYADAEPNSQGGAAPKASEAESADDFFGDED